MTIKPKVLFADSDEMFAVAAGYVLESSGHEVNFVHDGAELARVLEVDRPDLLIVGTALLEAGDGLNLEGLQPLLEKQNSPFVLVLGQTRDETLCADALEAGADDFLAKPFGMKEFVARVHALLRRGQLHNLATRPGEVKFGNFNLNIDKLRLRVVTEGGVRTLDLTQREAQIMEQLMLANGEYTPRQEISGRIWNDEPVTERTINTFEVHLRNLRKKLEKASGHDWHIESKRAIGVRLQGFAIIFVLFQASMVMPPQQQLASQRHHGVKVSVRRTRGRRLAGEAG